MSDIIIRVTMDVTKTVKGEERENLLMIGEQDRLERLRALEQQLLKVMQRELFTVAMDDVEGRVKVEIFGDGYCKCGCGEDGDSETSPAGLTASD